MRRFLKKILRHYAFCGGLTPLCIPVLDMDSAENPQELVLLKFVEIPEGQSIGAAEAN